MKVYIGCPTYNGYVHMGTCQAVFLASNQHMPDQVRFIKTSLLPNGFNQLWTQAINMREAYGITHFAMIHADIVPEYGWLDKLAETMIEGGYTVVSAVAPIKDMTGRTSCAIGTPGHATDMTSILLSDIWSGKYPPVITNSDMPEGKILLMNTGLWLADIRDDWCKKCSFAIETWTETQSDGMVAYGCISEDWLFSHQLHSLGIPYAVDTRIRLQHDGSILYPNYRDDKK